MNNWHFLGVEVFQAHQNFMTPFFDNFEFWFTHFLEILPETTTRDYFSNEMDLFCLFTDPCADESYDVRVVQLFYQFYF